MNELAIGQLIKKQRLATGMSQSALAACIPRERSWLAHVERGDCVPTVEQVLALAQRLDVPPETFLLHSPLSDQPANAPETRMRRQVVRQFSSWWRNEHKPGCERSTQGVTFRLLQDFLNRAVSDDILRSKLKRLSLGFREAAQLALRLIERGAQWARLSWSEVGFPVAMVDRERYCLNHCPRPCLVWSDGVRSLAFFGESFGATPRYVPPVLAWTDQNLRRYMVVCAEENGNGLNTANDLKPRIVRSQESNYHRSALQRINVAGVSAEQIGKWLDQLLIRNA